MYIAQQKRRENIAEYILYLWQLEDLLRALKFSPEAIYTALVEPNDCDESDKQQIFMWYMSLAGLLQEEGKSVALGHFNYINPLPKGVEEIFARYKKIVVCELNEGQFANYLRMNFQQFTYEQFNKCQGLPFTTVELEAKFNELLEK